MSAAVDAALCIGCAACIDVCPMQAISMEDGLAVVAAERCTGCAACIPECPRGALSMVPLGGA